MKAIAIGDIHSPWIHKQTFSQILQIVEAFQPDYIVQVGDLYDFYSWSRFPKKPGVADPEQELHDGRKTAEEMWRLLQKASRRSKCHQIKGNHCDRPVKLAKEKAPELMPFVGPAIHKLYEFDGVQTTHDSTEELVIEDIVFMHGFRSKLGDHCKHNGMKTVHGHTHRGGVHYHPTFKGELIWELDAGLVGDPACEPLQYNPQRYNHWTKGLGMIDSWGPRFIPLGGKK